MLHSTSIGHGSHASKDRFKRISPACVSKMDVRFEPREKPYPRIECQCSQPSHFQTPKFGVTAPMQSSSQSAVETTFQEKTASPNFEVKLRNGSLLIEPCRMLRGAKVRSEHGRPQLKGRVSSSL